THDTPRILTLLGMGGACTDRSKQWRADSRMNPAQRRRGVELLKVGAEVRTAQEEDHQKLYRESAIKKQLEYLQNELDEMHPENLSDLQKLEQRLQDAPMNETARKECGKVLNRLKQEGKNSAEYGLLYDYLDFMAGLPWRKEEAADIDLDAAEAILDEDHFGLEKVKRRVIQQIAVMSLKKVQSGSILLFVGAPGTGKTSIGQSIARALDRKYVRVSLGGVRDEADIRGHRRTYIGAMPGRIIDGIQKSGVSNPVMVLDEVDKLSVSYNGDPASALLEVLDPEQNSNFTDHYLNVPFDLSDVLFICTANSLETIPQPLLDRMEVIRFRGYTAAEKLQIALRHLLPRAMDAVGLGEEQLTIPEETVRDIIDDYIREAGVRGLKKCMDVLCRSAAVRLVRGVETPIVIGPEELRECLDTQPLHHRRVKDSAKPGVVTGLAWTQVGGEVLTIETLLTKGTGRTTVTGQLGDVMKESAQIAVSLVKHMFPDKAELFEKNDLHIHVPDGATPKDGPSAGITLTVSLASLVTGVPLSPAVAMTGEVSLQGDVKAIGGLPEKLMAAQRAGVKTVFIPEENADDLRDVAQEVRDQLEIVPVREAAEVLERLRICLPVPELRAV
ncbi:MAG: endopeptidase La, partial [Oscillospiraceae bacterium]|nr:endopeptidase La [Oscillospiraceae bacterium]